MLLDSRNIFLEVSGGVDFAHSPPHRPLRHQLLGLRLALGGGGFFWEL